ncbi:MAG: cellobiose phosphorylase [Candidatus Omnitrophica bacterium]|nr:cellobiose phosphorylase [Candidatus Omnitrophota bacterium]
MKNTFFKYIDDGITFTSEKAAQLRNIYFPLCGPESTSLKSSITPYLSGDIKIDKFRYLTKPMSREDLRHSARDFFLFVDGKTVVSLTQEVAGGFADVEIGLLWQKLNKRYFSGALEMETLNFIPVSGENVELMSVKISNRSDKPISFVPTSSLAIFGRALANKHDHEHVTALLNRIEQIENGVIVSPAMYFNEEGHKPNSDAYFVLGFAENGVAPEGSFPTVESFVGDSGVWEKPQAVYKNIPAIKLTTTQMQGKEAAGALRFTPVTLEPRRSKTYYILTGIADNKDQVKAIFSQFNTAEKFEAALQTNKDFWKTKSNAVTFKTGDASFNAWMHWVTIQPVLRRVFGCSFLPDHDYGKGGKGWRDLWQDLLSLILIEPEQVRENLINNFGGVRIDGSNATIIGSKSGEFIADRNAITRVWMDHGVWPYLTTALYIDQTGDFDILLHNTTYFRDPQMSRSFEKDEKWNAQYGNFLKDKKEQIFNGSILEHILVQHLVQFFNVGEHNITRLESADWNDGLDMAFKRGESVTFMSLYAGNLNDLANMLEKMAVVKKIDSVELADELKILLDTLSGKTVDYNSASQKQDLLFKSYFKVVQPELSGRKTKIAIVDLVKDLRLKAAWAFDFIRKQETITVEEDGGEYSWFNGYYDNKAERVEGKKDNNIRMTLTGQVFPIMSGLADDKDIPEVIRSVQKFLKDKKLGGYRLNTNFGIPHYLDLGRAFGFAYGTKENGAFFSHMIVMYAFALYKRGYVPAGYEVLKSIYNMCMDTDKSRIYPGVPEYLDSEGRGMYHYLTGSASWLVYAELAQVFGVRGDKGDLLLEPKLVKEQFAGQPIISVISKFAGKNIEVCYRNDKGLDFGEYKIAKIMAGSQLIDFEKITPKKVKIARDVIQALQDGVRIIVSFEAAI